MLNSAVHESNGSIVFFGISSRAYAPTKYGKWMSECCLYATKKSNLMPSNTKLVSEHSVGLVFFRDVSLHVPQARYIACDSYIYN